MSPCWKSARVCSEQVTDQTFEELAALVPHREAWLRSEWARHEQGFPIDLTRRFRHVCLFRDHQSQALVGFNVSAYHSAVGWELDSFVVPERRGEHFWWEIATAWLSYVFSQGILTYVYHLPIGRSYTPALLRTAAKIGLTGGKCVTFEGQEAVRCYMTASEWKERCPEGAPFSLES